MAVEMSAKAVDEVRLAPIVITNGSQPESVSERRNAKHWFATVWPESGSKAVSEIWLRAKMAELGEKWAVSRWTGQAELAPETQKLHLQLYIGFEKCCRAGPQLEKVFGLGWFRPCKGSWQAAAAYCTKLESRHAGPWASDDSFASECKRLDKYESRKEEIKVGPPFPVSGLPVWKPEFPFQDSFAVLKPPVEKVWIPDGVLSHAEGMAWIEAQYLELPEE